MNNYPYWKILLWRFIRAGVAGGIGTTASISLVIRPDFSNLIPLVTLLGTSFLAGFIAGLISAIFLALRDWVSNGDQTAPINKLPI